MTYVNISGMLEEGLGITLSSPVLIEETTFTYPIKSEAWENWFPFAYLAFQRLSERLSQESVKSFATIGTGSGADAIGALHTFSDLDALILTDVDERVVPLARRNVASYTGNVNLLALAGSLCQPLREHNLKIDLIYENLPNIPDAKDIINGYKRASRYKAGSFKVNYEPAQEQVARSYLLPELG